MPFGSINRDRRQQALTVRVEAAQLANQRDHPPHTQNTEELRYRKPSDGTPSHIASFTKGLPHDRDTGVIINSDDFQDFIRAVDSGDDVDIRRVALGPRRVGDKPRFQSGIACQCTDTRAWESMAAGLTFDLEGPDAQAVTMPPAPALDSDEFAAEMTENYWMALCRDVNFSDFSNDEHVGNAVASMNQTAWIRATQNPPWDLNDQERSRLRGPFTRNTIFRGITPGDDVGPYISQFLLVGNTGIANGNNIEDGMIQYGAMRINQRVRVALDRDYMTTWEAWLDVQNGANVAGSELYVHNGDKFRFITTPRDLTTFVHFDALYQAYLNACLILLAIKAPFDKGIPFQRDDDCDKQQGFATFGGPHILTLVTEVATRALKAVRFQKFNVHRRLRPEATGGLIERYNNEPNNELFAGVKPLFDALDRDLLRRIARLNGTANATITENGNPRSDDFSPTGRSEETLLLPMAFPEGSPMHPTYGAGHAAVAGACVTVLKAFFDHGHELDFAFAPDRCGMELMDVRNELGCKKLTVEGELNKICSNISIGRNWAGVHYFTDYIESIRLGEKIAIGLLEEQKLTYKENFSMTIPMFDGTVYRI